MNRSSKNSSLLGSAIVAPLVAPTPMQRRLAAVLTPVLTIAMLYLGTRPGTLAYVPNVPWDKLAHLVVFFGYGTLAWIMFASRSLIWPIIVAALIGFLDESMQFFTPGRVADPFDLAVDVGGAILAVLVLRHLQIRATQRVD